VGHLCEPFKVEMVIRGYSVMPREYAWQKRKNMRIYFERKNKFPEPIITPTTKRITEKHDADISREDILSKGIVTEEDYCFRKSQEICFKEELKLLQAWIDFGGY
jgi:phosphoribosylaminoimidazole-succinocarboxamide synthase